MKILFVTENFPYPLDSGGNVRSYHILRGLAQEHEVVVLANGQREVTPAHRRAIAGHCSGIELVPTGRRGYLRDLARLARSMIDGSPFLLARHYRKDLARRLRSLFSATRFDAVHFNHLDAALYARLVPAGTWRVLDEHNIVTNQTRSMLDSEPSRGRRWVLDNSLRRLAPSERSLCNLMDRCLVCSDDDARSLSALGVDRPIVVVPNGVDLEYFRMGESAGARARTMIFVGTLDYDPCEKAVWYFCREILPLIRQKLPDAGFVAVGRNPSPRLRRLAESDRGIELTGRVKDVRTHVWSAGASIVPLLSGSGTRLKILEAMAMGSPIVTTSIGVEGIPARHGEHVLVADTAGEFAAAAVRLLQDPALAGELAASARRLVEAAFSWTAIQQGLLGEYRTLALRGAV